jgi:hypothetical protein
MVYPLVKTGLFGGLSSTVNLIRTRKSAAGGARSGHHRALTRAWTWQKRQWRRARNSFPVRVLHIYPPFSVSSDSSELPERRFM